MPLHGDLLRKRLYKSAKSIQRRAKNVSSFSREHNCVTVGGFEAFKTVKLELGCLLKTQFFHRDESESKKYSGCLVVSFGRNFFSFGFFFD
jgi:hypothetical protein